MYSNREEFTALTREYFKGLVSTRSVADYQTLTGLQQWSKVKAEVDVALRIPKRCPTAAEIMSGRLIVKGNEVGVLMLLRHRNDPCEGVYLHIQSGSYSYDGQLVPKTLVVLSGEQHREVSIEITPTTTKIFMIIHPKE